MYAQKKPTYLKSEQMAFFKNLHTHFYFVPLRVSVYYILFWSWQTFYLFVLLCHSNFPIYWQKISFSGYYFDQTNVEWLKIYSIIRGKKIAVDYFKFREFFLLQKTKPIMVRSDLALLSKMALITWPCKLSIKSVLSGVSCLLPRVRRYWLGFLTFSL